MKRVNIQSRLNNKNCLVVVAMTNRLYAEELILKGTLPKILILRKPIRKTNNFFINI